MYQISVGQYKAPNYTFFGVELARASTRRPGVDRWSEIVVYLQDDDRYVCQSIGRSTRPGESDRSRIKIVEDEQGIMDFFGWSGLSKDLYPQLGIEYTDSRY